MCIARKKYCFALVLAAFAMGAANEARADKVLRWKFKEGDTNHFAVKMDIATDMTIMGVAQKQNIGQIIDVTWVVTSVDDRGTAGMTQTIDRMQMKIMGGPVALNLDSDGPEPTDAIGKLIAPLLKAMVKRPFTMKMDARGAISDVKPPEGLAETLKANPVLAQMGNMFSDDNLKQMTGAGALEFPEAAVADGSNWEQDATIDTPFAKQTVTTTHTLEGTEPREGGDLEKITQKLNTSLAPIPNAPAKIEIKEQDGTGTIYFDNAAGTLVEGQTKVTMKMQITVMGMVIPQSVETSVSIKSVEPPAEK